MVIDFLWRLRGSRALENSPENDRVMASVERLLSRQGKQISRRTPELVAFNDPLWRLSAGSNWRAMLVYDRGRFWIERGPRGRRLHYDLRSLHGFLFCAAGAGALFTFVLANGLGFRNAGGAAALGFGWVYGMNLLIAIPRVWLAIGSAVREAERAG